PVGPDPDFSVPDVHRRRRKVGIRSNGSLRKAPSTRSSYPLDLIPTFLCRISTAAAAERVLDTILPKIGQRDAARFADLTWRSEPALQAFFPRYLEMACGIGLRRKVHADHEAPAAAIELGLHYGATSIDHLEYATP